MNETEKRQIADKCGLTYTELEGQMETIKDWNLNEHIESDRARVTLLTGIAAMNTQELSDAIRDADVSIASLTQEIKDIWDLNLAKQTELGTLTLRKKTVQSELLSRLVPQEP